MASPRLHQLLTKAPYCFVSGGVLALSETDAAKKKRNGGKKQAGEYKLEPLGARAVLKHLADSRRIHVDADLLSVKLLATAMPIGSLGSMAVYPSKTHLANVPALCLSNVRHPFVPGPTSGILLEKMHLGCADISEALESQLRGLRRGFVIVDCSACPETLLVCRNAGPSLQLCLSADAAASIRADVSTE